MSLTKNKKQTLLLLLILMFPVAVFSLLFLGAYYCHPNIEDYSLVLLPRDIGIYKSIRMMMVTYDGRYFTNLLHALNPLYFNSISGYKWMPVIGVLFFNSTLYLFLTTILSAKKSHILILASVITAFHFAIVPSLPHQLYWMVSSFVYLYTWSFLFLFFYFFNHYWNGLQKNASLWWYGLSAICLVAVTGMNEMFLPLLILFLLCSLFLSFGTPRFKAILPLVLIGVLAIAFFISSPGISGRLEREYKGESIDYSISIMRGANQYFYFFKKNLSYPLVLFFILLLFVFKNLYSLQSQIESRLSTFTKKMFFIVFIFILGYFMVQPYYIPIGHIDAFPKRIYNVIQVLYILGIIIFIFSLPKFKMDGLENVHFRIFVVVGFLVFFYFTNNNWTKMKREFSTGVWSAFDAEMEARYALIEKSKFDPSLYKLVTLPPLRHIPQTIYFPPDLTPHRKENNWNKALAAFFYLDEVRLVGDSIQNEMK